MAAVASTMGGDGGDGGDVVEIVDPPPVPSTPADAADTPVPVQTIAEVTTTTDMPVTTLPAIESSSVDTADDTVDESTVSEPVDPQETPAFPVQPDGSPVPVVAVYDGAVVTLTGLVPSEDARMRLEALAIAGAPEPNTVAVNLLEINENVPISVGARVVSLDSARFPDGSAEILPEHAAELDGVVRTLESLPNVTLLVIGHTDEEGDDFENLVLSRDRADSMVFYLVSQGIDPSRLSSRSVGESNPITAENGEAARQLNRRTELIFYGLLAG